MRAGDIREPNLHLSGMELRRCCLICTAAPVEKAGTHELHTPMHYARLMNITSSFAGHFSRSGRSMWPAAAARVEVGSSLSVC